nr:MAG TPA: hypothetical protein [Caudoviricetes sp.]
MTSSLYYVILHNVKRGTVRESPVLIEFTLTTKNPKKFQNFEISLLTNSQICDILITESERNTSKIGWRPTPNKERGIL